MDKQNPHHHPNVSAPNGPEDPHNTASQSRDSDENNHLYYSPQQYAIPGYFLGDEHSESLRPL
jgi:hypothetical protein